jgi:hypothetical protein
MIICRKCGKVKTYKTRQIVKREIVYDERGLDHFKFISEKEGKPRCIKCGRLVKFFKDEESEDWE